MSFKSWKVCISGKETVGKFYINTLHSAIIGQQIPYCIEKNVHKELVACCWNISTC